MVNLENQLKIWVKVYVLSELAERDTELCQWWWASGVGVRVGGCYSLFPLIRVFTWRNVTNVVIPIFSCLLVFCYLLSLRAPKQMYINVANLLLFILASKHQYPWRVLYGFGLRFLWYCGLKSQPYKK